MVDSTDYFLLSEIMLPSARDITAQISVGVCVRVCDQMCDCMYHGVTEYVLMCGSMSVFVCVFPRPYILVCVCIYRSESRRNRSINGN